MSLKKLRKKIKNKNALKPLDDLTRHELAAAMALQHQGQNAQAEILYNQILARNPRCAIAWQLLGVMAFQCGQNDMAIKLIGRAIEIDASQAPFYYNLAVVLQNQGDLEKAATHYRKALRLQPEYGNALENLGVIEIDLGNLEQARQVLERALHLNPNSQLALLNLGSLYSRLDLRADALRCFDATVSRQPASAEAHMKRGSELLAQGDLANGWADYAWRWYSPDFLEGNKPAHLPFPRWDGSHPADKHLLVVGEQGLGDEVMFATCLPDLIRRAAQVSIACTSRLMPFFSKAFSEATICDRHQLEDPQYLAALGIIDGWLPLGNLPGIYRPTLESFCPQQPLFKADPHRTLHWRRKLSDLGGRCIGISWFGGKASRAQNARSLPLPMWRDLFALPGVRFVNLQYGDHRQDIAEFNKKLEYPLVSFPEIDPLRDLEDFAALISALDLVISVDNSTVHLAGALGAPCWALIPLPADWRWFNPGAATPWYSSVSLIRQQAPGGESWQRLLSQVREDLSAWIAAPRPPRSSADLSSSKPLPQKPLTLKPAMPQVMLLNDTSGWYHWGCSCTSLAIHEQLRARGFAVDAVPIQETPRLPNLPQTIEQLDVSALQADLERVAPEFIRRVGNSRLVIINGEGTLHGTGPAAINLLGLAYLIQRKLNIPVQIINHSCYPDDLRLTTESPAMDFYREVYAALDFVAVREEISANLLASAGLQVTSTFDCLPLFIEHQYPNRPSRRNHALVIAGSVAWSDNMLTALLDLAQSARNRNLAVEVIFGARAYPAGDDIRFIERLFALGKELLTLVHVGSEIEWLQRIGSAQLLVSGRFHHSLAAAFLGTPFLLMPSNTHKVEGLVQLLNCGDNLLKNDATLSASLMGKSAHFLDSPSDYDLAPDRRQRLLSLARANFNGLAKFL